MTRKQIERLYHENEKMLHSLAHKAASRCGRPEEDLFGEACWLFMRACEGFDPGRGVAFGTYLWRAVHNGLIAFAVKQDLAPDPEHVPEAATTITPDRQLILQEWLNNLSKEAHDVATIILEGPAEVMMLSLQSLHRLSLHQIKEHLHRERGWSWPTIWSAMRELKREVARL